MMIGIVVFVFILLLALIGSLSDRDERRYSRDGYRRGRGGYGRYPDEHWDTRYGRYEDDYWEDDYDRRGDYYRRRRGGMGIIRGFIVSVFLAILVFIALIPRKDPIPNPTPPLSDVLDLDDNQETQRPEQVPSPMNVSKLDTKEYSSAQLADRPDPVPVSAAPQWEYLDLQNRPFCIRLALTKDSQKAMHLKTVYAHRKVEIFQDDLDRYWVLIFIRNSQEMAETVEMLQLRQEDLINHGCNIVPLKTSNLCTGQLKRIKGTDFWSCAE